MSQTQVACFPETAKSSLTLSNGFCYSDRKECLGLSCCQCLHSSLMGLISTCSLLSQQNSQLYILKYTFNTFSLKWKYESHAVFSVWLRWYQHIRVRLCSSYGCDTQSDVKAATVSHAAEEVLQSNIQFHPPCNMWVQVCWCGRLERRLINSRVPGIDLFIQMRQQDVGVATEITITSAAAL